MEVSPMQYLFLVILLAFSALFSAAETSMTSISKIRLRNMVDENVKGAKKLELLLSTSKKLISSILIGNNIVNIGATTLATSITISLTGNNNTALAIATVLTTVTILIFAEITPKTLAAQNSEKIALAVTNFISFVMWILAPIVFILNIVTNFIMKIFGANDNSKSPFITEAELKTMVNVSHEEGVLEVEEKMMINNVFDFGDSHAKDVMTPRIDIVAIPYTATYQEIIDTFKREEFSRMPIYKESTDDIVGAIHLKDFAFYENIKPFDINDYIREVYHTYESQPTSELFKIMRKEYKSIAVVLDEYGGTSGIVTLEDLIEEIVGEIFDEYDDEEVKIKLIKEDEYIIDGDTKLTDVNEMLGLALECEMYESIGGYVTDIMGHIPKKGEKIEIGNIKFVVESEDKNKIDKLRISLRMG